MHRNIGNFLKKFILIIYPNILIYMTRATFRGHVDSVNDVHFKPYTNIFASASADKTVFFIKQR